MTKLSIPHPDEWNYGTLEDACELISRGKAPVYVEQSEVLAIGQRCVQNQGFVAEDARPHAANLLTGHLIAIHRDLLLNSTGTGTIGRACLFDQDGVFIVDGHVTLLRTHQDRANSQWLKALVQTSYFQRHLEVFCYTGSTNQIELSRAHLAAVEVPSPSPNEQALIAAILDTVDDAIRYTEQMIAKLKQVRAGLLHDLLTYGIDENGEMRDPVRHPVVFKDGIPTTWVEYTLGEVVPTAEYGISTALSDDGNGIPVLRMNNIFNGEISLADLKYASETAVQRLILNPLDVLFNRTNSIEHVGRTGIWRGQLEIASFASYLVRLVPQVTLLEPEFLNYWLNWATTQIKIRRFATPGVHQVNINPTSLRKSRIVLPPKSEQIEAIRVLTNFDHKLQFESQSLYKLHLLKQGLMDDLLTGRVRVVDLLSAEE